MFRASQNLFETCQLTVNKDIKRNVNLEEEVTYLGFKIVGFTPLKIEINELTEDIFKKLTTALKKYSQSDNLSEPFELVNWKFDADYVHNDVIAKLNISDASKETCKNELEIAKLDFVEDSNNRSITTENIEVDFHHPNDVTKKHERTQITQELNNTDRETASDKELAVFETTFEEKLLEAIADSSPIVKDLKDRKLESIAVASPATLRNFISVLFVDVSENNARKWKKLLREYHKEIKILYDKDTETFKIMGSKYDVVSAETLIRKLKGNKDTDMIHTNKTLFLNSNKDERKYCSSDLGLLKTNKDDELKGAKSSTSSFKREKEKHFASPMQPDYQTSSTSHEPLGFQKYMESRSRNIKKDQKGNIFVGKSDLKVRICKADITKLDVDMIVNAANYKLIPIGGVALAISKEAGYELVKECEEFIKKNGSLRVTEAFISKGGRLKAKYVTHAVGPKWDCYEDKRNCLKDLRHTVLRCLIEASRRSMRIVALPSISAAKSKVPAKQCAETYMAAVKSFDYIRLRLIRQKLSLSSLEEVLFVDVNEELVYAIQDEFLCHWKNNTNKYLIQEDILFCNQQLNISECKDKFGFQEFAGKEKKHSSSTFNASGSKPKESEGLGSTRGITKGKQKSYEFKHLKIMISSEPALRISDEIVIVFGDPFDKLSGLPDFECKKCQEHKGSDEFKPKGFKLFVSHMDGTSSKKIYCLKLDAVNKEGFIKGFEILASLDMSLLSSATDISVVITCHIFYPAQHNPDFKIVTTYAEVFHKFLPRLSQDKNLKCIRMSVCEDTFPSISKVFDTRADLKKTKEAYVLETRKTTHGLTDDSQHRDLRTTSRAYNTGSRSSSKHPPSGTSLTAASSQFTSQGGAPVDFVTDCPLCYDGKPSTLLHCCNVTICDSCFKKVQICPYCRTFFKILTGDQPDGKMLVNYSQYKHAAGYEHCGVWEIQYYFKSGTEKENHPNPGKLYPSISRTAYLPDTNEGFDVLLLLKLSFMRQLTFTIGLSLTMNLEDKITWNDIHHKTSLDGGSHGYPDPNYLKRVLQELEGKGVTFESLTPEEKLKLDHFKSEMMKQKN